MDQHGGESFGRERLRVEGGIELSVISTSDDQCDSEPHPDAYPSTNTSLDRRSRSTRRFGRAKAGRK